MDTEVCRMTLKELVIITASNTTNSFYHGKPLVTAMQTWLVSGSSHFSEKDLVT